MLSEELTTRALEALAPARETFRSAVAGTVDDVRALITRSRAGEDGAGRGRELGIFAAGRIDLDRFTAVFERGEMLGNEALAAIDRGLEVLEEIAAWGGDRFVTRLHAGEDLRGAVAATFAVCGRAFGAARAVELARSHRFLAGEHGDLFGAFGVERWNRAERQIAPPLVIDLPGGELRAGGLAEFLDGAQKLVLVVHPPAPPAALVRLITPGVLVAQIADVAQLAELVAFEGPAVVGIVPDTAARFVHDPRRGARLADRLAVTHMPVETPRGQLGTLSAFQRTEELEQLAALAEAAAAPPPAAPAPGAGPAVQPADQLAAWLLRQAGLSNP